MGLGERIRNMEQYTGLYHGEEMKEVGEREREREGEGERRERRRKREKRKMSLVSTNSCLYLHKWF